MTCPFKTKTEYTKQVRTFNKDTNTWETATVTCAAKDAHTVAYGFGLCDGAACPYYAAGGDIGCGRVKK